MDGLFFFQGRCSHCASPLDAFSRAVKLLCVIPAARSRPGQVAFLRSPCVQRAWMDRTLRPSITAACAGRTMAGRAGTLAVGGSDLWLAPFRRKAVISFSLTGVTLGSVLIIALQASIVVPNILLQPCPHKCKRRHETVVAFLRSLGVPEKAAEGLRVNLSCRRSGQAGGSQ